MLLARTARPRRFAQCALRAALAACGALLFGAASLPAPPDGPAPPPESPAPLPVAPTELRAGDLRVTVIPHTWPRRPRLEGYEYNQKNHHDEPEFVAPGRSPLRRTGSGKRFRVVGIRIENEGDLPRPLRLRSKRLRRRQRLPFDVEPGERRTRYFAIEVNRELPLDIDLTEKKVGPVLQTSVDLAPALHETRDAREALAVAAELESEDRVRRELRTREIEIDVRDDLGAAVAGARVLVLQRDGLMAVEGLSDRDGRVRLAVLPGACDVYAHAELPRRGAADDPTTSREPPRLLALRQQLPAGKEHLELSPTRVVECSFTDVDAAPLSLRHLWVTPTELQPSYRFELVAAAVGDRARAQVDVRGGVSTALIACRDEQLELAALCEPAPLTQAFLRGRVSADEDLVHVRFAPDATARAVLDPATGPGPGRSAQLVLVAVDGTRERIEVATEDLATLYLWPGAYRADLRYRTAGGREARFIPFAFEVPAGGEADLTPRGPFSLTLFHERKGKKIQLWLAIADRGGRVLQQPPGAITRYPANGRPAPLGALRWELAAGAENVDLESLFGLFEVEFDEELVRAQPRIETFSVANAEGASGSAPAPLIDRVRALLPEVKRAADGSKRLLDLPRGTTLRIHMDFDVLLPPGVGGLGGGGTIVLDLPALYGFAAPTDLYPGAFRHEFGHNLGFGHDPYMLMAPCGIDEERFGTFGYRMLNAPVLQRALSYIEGDRTADSGPWRPDPGVFPALRFLYGEDVHRRMMQERAVHEKVLTLHGLSSIERIAALYSLALDRNVAWVFRALGWPVTDAVVERGAVAARFAKKHPPQLDYSRVEGTPISAWWVYGPARSGGDEQHLWRRVQWPSRFVDLDEDRPAADFEQQYLLYRRVRVPRAVDAQLLCASDVQLEIRVNGNPIATLDASPQYSQPLHDEHMLDQKRPYSVHLLPGVNEIEVAANQPPGARGFVLEAITPAGKPLPIALAKDGPAGEELARGTRSLKRRDPVRNGSFERGGSRATGWIRGPVDGSLEFRPEKAAPLPDGARALRARLGGPARGGFIQRVVVEPGKRYRLHGALRTRGFRGQSWVSLFGTDVHSAAARTEPLRASDGAWRELEAKWFAGTSRVIYVACYVEGTAGEVWFDDVGLEVTK